MAETLPQPTEELSFNDFLQQLSTSFKQEREIRRLEKEKEGFVEQLNPASTDEEALTIARMAASTNEALKAAIDTKNSLTNPFVLGHELKLAYWGKLIVARVLKPDDDQFAISRGVWAHPSYDLPAYYGEGHVAEAVGTIDLPPMQDSILFLKAKEGRWFNKKDVRYHVHLLDSETLEPKVSLAAVDTK